MAFGLEGEEEKQRSPSTQDDADEKTRKGASHARDSWLADIDSDSAPSTKSPPETTYFLRRGNPRRSASNS